MGRPEDASHLTGLAAATATRPATAAIGWMWRGSAEAAAGDPCGFESAMDQARTHLNAAMSNAPTQPVCSYWLIEDILDAEKGWGWIDLAGPCPPGTHARRARSWSVSRDQVMYGAALAAANLAAW